ncbi:MAG: hypothetical protein ACHQ1G_11360, partial [Planctomycetota bacterium]
QQAALDLLESCGLDGIGAYLEALGIQVSIVNPAAAVLPPIEVFGVNQMQGSMQWRVNLGGDPAPEYIGIIQFSNQLDQPAEPPFDLTQFQAAGLGTFDQFLVQLPDGWSVTVTANAPLDPLVNSRVSFTYTATVVSDTDGNANIQAGACGTIFVFTGISLANLAGPFPTGEFMTTYNGNATALNGSTTFDGTDVVIVDGDVNAGTTVYTFEADLGAGTVVTVP